MRLATGCRISDLYEHEYSRQRLHQRERLRPPSGNCCYASPDSLYLAFPSASEVVYECPNADACIGGATVETYCSDGFKGPREFIDEWEGDEVLS